MPSITLPGGRNGRNANQPRRERPAPPPQYPDAWRGQGIPEPPLPAANPFPVPQTQPIDLGQRNGGSAGWADKLGSGLRGQPGGGQTNWLPPSGGGGGKKGGGGGGSPYPPQQPGEHPGWRFRNWFLGPTLPFDYRWGDQVAPGDKTNYIPRLVG